MNSYSEQNLVDCMRTYANGYAHSKHLLQNLVLTLNFSVSKAATGAIHFMLWVTLWGLVSPKAQNIRTKVSKGVAEVKLFLQPSSYQPHHELCWMEEKICWKLSWSDTDRSSCWWVSQLSHKLLRGFYFFFRNLKTHLDLDLWLIQVAFIVLRIVHKHSIMQWLVAHWF